MIRLQIVLITTLLLFVACAETDTELVLDTICRGKVCYEVVDRPYTEVQRTDVRLRELRHLLSASSHLVISRGVLTENVSSDSKTPAFREHSVADESDRATIGALFASQTISMRPKSVNVLYSTDSPGEIDRYFAQNSQFNVTALVSNTIALDIAKKWMGIEDNGVKYIADPGAQYLDHLQSTGDLFDVYIIDRWEIVRGHRSCPTESVIDWNRLHLFTSLLNPNGVLIIRLTSDSAPARMAEMVLGGQFSTCYKYPEAVYVRRATQIVLLQFHISMNSPPSSRTTSENEREELGSPRLPAEFVLPSSSSTDLESTYLPPPPPPRKRILAAPLPTNSRAKRAIFAADIQPVGVENEHTNEDVTRRESRTLRPNPLPCRQSYPRMAKTAAAAAATQTKQRKPPKKD